MQILDCHYLDSMSDCQQAQTLRLSERGFGFAPFSNVQSCVVGGGGFCACSPCVSMGFLLILWFPPTSRMNESNQPVWIELFTCLKRFELDCLLVLNKSYLSLQVNPCKLTKYQFVYQ